MRMDLAAPEQQLHPTTPLQITDEAVNALGHTVDPDYAITDPEDIAQAREVLTAVAPHIVAVELRRLANDLFIPAGSLDEAAVLLGRADALDGGAR